MPQRPGHRSNERSRIGATLDAAALARALAGGADALEREAAAINAINVFPVPDGDTGTNMASTVRAAVDAVDAGAFTDAASVAKTAADAALMGAKGNSGVILSQVLAGFAGAVARGTEIDAATLAEAFAHGRDAAYRAVSQPKEGTILTAITAAADALAGARDIPADDALEAAARAADDAVARTPDLLPVLREAGVVDAGAQGFAVLLHGMVAALRGEAPAASTVSGAINPEWLAARAGLHADGGAEGYCTEFVVTGAGAAADTLRETLTRLGTSVLVVEAEQALRVHVHTREPERVLAHARDLGDVSREKVQDMDAQFRELHATTGAAPAVAVVAVAPGDGFADLFRSLGAVVVRGGATMNPSAGEIRAAVESTRAADVIVLPGDKNIVLAAEQAGRGLAQTVHVLRATSVPRSVAALAAMNPEVSADENVAAMNGVLDAVKSAEITYAARDTQLDGRALPRGTPIGLVDDELVVAAESIDDAVMQCVRRAAPSSDSIITLYAGVDVASDAAEALAARLRDEFAAEVEVVAGGQPHYPYLVGVE